VFDSSVHSRKLSSCKRTSALRGGSIAVATHREITCPHRRIFRAPAVSSSGQGRKAPCSGSRPAGCGRRPDQRLHRVPRLPCSGTRSMRRMRTSPPSSTTGLAARRPPVEEEALPLLTRNASPAVRVRAEVFRGALLDPSGSLLLVWTTAIACGGLRILRDPRRDLPPRAGSAPSRQPQRSHPPLHGPATGSWRRSVGGSPPDLEEAAGSRNCSERKASRAGEDLFERTDGWRGPRALLGDGMGASHPDRRPQMAAEIIDYFGSEIFRRWTRAAGLSSEDRFLPG